MFSPYILCVIQKYQLSLLKKRINFYQMYQLFFQLKLSPFIFKPSKIYCTIVLINLCPLCSCLYIILRNYLFIKTSLMKCVKNNNTDKFLFKNYLASYLIILNGLKHFIVGTSLFLYQVFNHYIIIVLKEIFTIIIDMINTRIYI